MQKLLFFLLGIATFWRRLLLRLKGKTEEDVHNQRIIDGSSWEEFCENLKSAGKVLKYPGTPQDPFQQAEGVRYLSRLTRAGLEAFLEFNDPAFPVLRRMVHETIKMGADNPDNYYFNAQISGQYEYRITGKRNTINYIGFFTQNGNYGTTGGLAPCGKLENDDLVAESDGSFEILVTRSPRGKNWLKLEEATSMLIVRQTFLNRNDEIPAEIKIVNLDGRTRPDPISARQVDEGLKTVSFFVAGAALLFARWANGFRQHTNQLPLFDPATSNAAGGDPAITYYHSHWKLAKDEALLIEVTPPDCDSWNFQLNNYWMESLDYRYHTVCINKASAVYLPDGKVQVIVAHEDPGKPNWIETCGHDEGTMCWRWYRIKKDSHAVEPSCKVINFHDLKNL